MGKLDGKVCIITGCAGGLGKQQAIRFAQEGAKLSICDIIDDRLEETKKLCEKEGAEVLSVCCDLTEYKELEDLVAKTVEQFGTIDALVNNAHCVTALVPFLEKEFDDLYLEMESSLYSYWHLMRLCFPYMKEKPGAGTSIINYASKAGIEGTENHVAYAAAKEAVRGMSRVVAREWGQYNIRINTVCPNGFTDNCEEGLKTQPKNIQEWASHAFKDNPFARAGDPYKDVAPVAVFLASDDSHWITGQNIHADGGIWITA